MTAYEMPAEPNVTALWTWRPPSPDRSDLTAIRWGRGTQHGKVVWRSGSAATCTWHELLTQGPVFDTHPDLDGTPPTPWTWDDERGMVDATGADIADRDETACLIVRAVNAYAAQLGGQS